MARPSVPSAASRARPVARRGVRRLAVILPGLGLAYCALSSLQMPGLTQTTATATAPTTAATASAASTAANPAAARSPRLQPRGLFPEGAVPRSPCGAALQKGQKAFEVFRESWASACSKGRLLPNFGLAAVDAEARVLNAFDAALAQEGSDISDCTLQRQALQSDLRREVLSFVLMQRQLTERVVGTELSNRLIRKMRQRGAPLRVQEKITLLREAVGSYRRRLASLAPAWAADEEAKGEPGLGLEDTVAEVERRLGEIQFRIEDSEDGKVLANLWDQSRARRLMSQRAHGVSVSVDPGLRVMLRPEGMGNLQIFSSGPIGPPNHPATVHVGVMNDGSISDVYREHPTPPKISVQPAVKVNVKLR